MTPGQVVHIRVNPKDCLSVLDVLDKLGISRQNLSFAQATKLALSSALEAFRQQGIIPTRSGFEYLEMMTPFTQHTLANRGAKLHLTNTRVEPLPIVPESPEVASRRRRYEELMIKKNADPLNFSLSEQEEFSPLIEEFFQ